MEHALRGVAVGTALMIAAFAPMPMGAQQQPRVHGHVVDDRGQPVTNAYVQVLPVGPEAITDRAGAFDLGSLDPGRYRVRVRRLGFRPVKVNLVVPMTRPDLTVTMAPVPTLLDTVRAHALEQQLPRVFERQREHLGGLVFGRELMKEHPGLSIDEILQTDSAVNPFLRGSGFPECHPIVYIDGKPMPRPMLSGSPFDRMRTIIPDLHIRNVVNIHDVAAIEVFRFAAGKIYEPWIGPDAGETCSPLILIWMKGYKQRPYKGP